MIAHRPTLLIAALLPTGIAAAGGADLANLSQALPARAEFSPTTVNLATGGHAIGTPSAIAVVSVSSVGGQTPGGYACTVPDGFQMTNAANPGVLPNSDPPDIAVTCTLGPAPRTASSTCMRNGFDPVVLTLNCPAAQASGVLLTTVPPNGTALACNGVPSSTQSLSVSVHNTGVQPVSGLACQASGAGFSIVSPIADSLAPGASSSVTVACNVPAAGAPAATGVLSCTSGSGGALVFPLSAQAQAGSTSPALVPSGSAFASAVLAGLLAVVGAGLARRRRNERATSG